MRTAATLTIALVVLLAGGPSASARSRCAKSGSKTVVSTKLVRVYSVRNKDDGRNLYGCLKSNDRRQRLTRSFDDGYVTSGSYSHVKVAGRFVAWQESYTDVSCKAACPPDYQATTTSIAVRDLKRRKTASSNGRVDGKLVLTIGGGVAWTQQAPTGEGVVNAFDGNGSRELDRGNVDLKSLSVSGSTVAWMKDGAIQSATLAPRS
jgi:hypothetical protein